MPQHAGLMHPSSFTIAAAQVNAAVGGIGGNAERIRRARAEAAAMGADLVVFPELALIGYAPEDMVLCAAFRAQAMRAAHALAQETAQGGPALLLGSVWEERGRVFNAALLMDEGRIVCAQHKTRLPNYGVFDEKRVFSQGELPEVMSWRGRRLGVLICEDAWTLEAPLHLRQSGAEMLIVLNASPFEVHKREARLEAMGAAARHAGLPVLYVNLVGGQDELVFDGGSFALSAAGEPLWQGAEFEEELRCLPWPMPNTVQNTPRMALEERLWQAMAAGLGDYVRKNGFTGVGLGLSGGVDSALVAALAVDALGAGQVTGVLLPSPYNAPESSEDALESARLLGIRTHTVPITPAMETYRTMFGPDFGPDDWMENVAVGGNLQARIRGTALMALSNRFGWMLLSTGNKSELAVGYSTLYGDSCGGFAPLKDLYKTQVYALARWRNRQGEAIPARSITKVPTAELAPGQTDQDQLPPYDVLDAILECFIEKRQGVEDAVAAGFERAVATKVWRMLMRSEYKRRQSPPGVKLSSMLLGRDRRWPMTHGFD